MKLLERCRQLCQQSPRRIVFPDACDARMLHAANRLVAESLAQPILIGCPFELRDLAHRSGVAMPCLTIIDPAASASLGPFSGLLHERRREKGMSETEARETMSQALYYGATMVEQGQADLCIAGNLSTTGDVIRAAIQCIGLAPGQKTVSSIFIMVSPDGEQTRVFSDAGVVPEPDASQLADIAIDSARNFAGLTGETPRVAMLSFSTHGSSNHPAALRVREAFERVREREPDLLVDGELQFDAAVVPSVAQQKAPDSPLQGQSNVLIFPSLSAGNIGYKVAQRLCNYLALGPLLQGLNKPMHDLSRGASVDDIVDVAVLASCMAAAP
jgi:phosphotransacetylase